MMPKLDGLGLLRALRADPTHNTIPVILLSARAREESRIEGLEAGADDYLIKPFSSREVVARVETHLKLSTRRALTSSPGQGVRVAISVPLRRETNENLAAAARLSQD